MNQNAENAIRDLGVALRDRDSKLQKQRIRINKLDVANRKLVNENKRLKDESAQWQTDYDHLDDIYKYVVDKCLGSYAQKRGIQFDDSTAESLDQVLEPLLQEAVQAKPLRSHVRTLRTQVQQLQKDLLAKLDKVEVVSDDQFSQEFRSLASLIKTLSRTVRVNDKVDILEGLGPLLLLNDVSSHHWNSRAGKKSLIEAWVWSILICLVFRNPFVFLGEHCKSLHEAWTQIFGAQHHHHWPRPSKKCENWRYKTMEQLVKLAGQDTITHGNVGLMPECLEASVIDNRTLVGTVIEGHFDLMFPGYDSSKVHPIVDKAFGLAMRMSLQRSRLQITYPAVGALLNRDEMSSIPEINGESDDEDMREGVVAFVINPGLAKWGDAHGENFDQRYDIVSALVQLEPTMRVERRADVEDQRSLDIQAGFAGGIDINGEPQIKHEPNIKQEDERT
ncbi:uncharacterized protein K460DRAFT_337550 [Cucurbitaria berberidis CBS 394.84]|uniref:Uncharacterized protein n=1 Tax=Cucurbitaria berberidis CBS 394.84 TaxID=1168544 RepID=A0A9P4GG12_9PLEO|nr:uncharacterized protein K460DRAFT_337550 [Cucurbitaria berberidis CBS 394.84]KAF1845398.1 hypothetical protein K460DRAFT_337550 [Cucurbitaria berberidis CBS 394.84]